MRCTVAFSVGYFVSDLILILIDKEVPPINPKPQTLNPKPQTPNLRP